MKKQKKQFIILILLLIVCVAGYLLVMQYNKKTQKKEQESEEASKITFAQFDADEVNAFSYVYQDANIRFTKDGDDWKYDGDASIDIDENQINSLLKQAAQMSATEKIENAKDASEYGFSEPKNTIVIETASGSETFYVGDYNEMLKEYYMKKDGDDSIYLVDSATGTLFQKTVENLTATKTDSTETEGTEIEDAETESAEIESTQ